MKRKILVPMFASVMALSMNTVANADQVENKTEISNQVSIACGKEMHIKYIEIKPQDEGELSEEEELSKFANQFDIPFDVIE